MSSNLPVGDNGVTAEAFDLVENSIFWYMPAWPHRERNDYIVHNHNCTIHIQTILEADVIGHNW